MEAKVQPQSDCHRGLRHTAGRALCQPETREHLNITTTITSKALSINELREAHWMRYRVNENNPILVILGISKMPK